MKDLKVAIICMHSVLGDIKGNLERIEKAAEGAAREGAQLVCFPESAATGYALKDPGNYCSARDTAHILDRLIRLGRDLKIVLLTGMIENTNGLRPYMAQVITGPKGYVGTYRKTHLSPTEKGLYAPGKEIGVFFHDGWCFGLQLCYEAHFPEISTKMALLGADLILMPHASPRGNPSEKFESWMRHLPARAFDNGVFVAACNPVGDNGEGLSFPGVSLLLGPDGRLLDRIQGDAETFLLEVLRGKDLQNIRGHRMKYFLHERRPECYQ
jgi:N-carbamoylputrescine amidase